MDEVMTGNRGPDYTSSYEKPDNGFLQREQIMIVPIGMNFPLSATRIFCIAVDPADAAASICIAYLLIIIKILR